eukprot:TRINITY_DN76994_c0_g1_i1.p1 TRINITY_DN76994_c0_g1~~TRINITY_DN76994_c0_g1_i1.p1  ORF type:complete len:290 (-),score=-11.62 TRINITY_DN76994_c0_g1_i1:16-885(-)
MDKGHFYEEFVAGNVGGLLGILIVYPLDTAKIRMQLYPHYTSMRNVLNSMIKADGYASLYRGLPSPSLLFGLNFAVSFSSYGYACKYISNYKNIDVNNLTLIDMTLAGGFAGACQSPVRQIMERCKSVMQVSESLTGKSKYTSTLHCFIQLIRNEGLKYGLFRGYSSVLLREIPQFAVYYPIYEYTKILYSKILPTDNKMMIQLLAGGSAGVAQWLPPIYYADIIKSKMQTAVPGEYNNVYDCMVKVSKEQGGLMKNYHRGLLTALLRSFPLHATIFLGYENTMKHLKK